MTTLKFKCTLLSDIILNQKAATEGPNKTLDFIPGSCFLGIAASTLYPQLGECERTNELFHSGKVRFGDAHPSSERFRGLKVPAAMYSPKLDKSGDSFYIQPVIPDEILESTEFRSKQIKQCRSGFYNFDKTTAVRISTDTNFAIKSAYDKENRCSKDSQMYGYESLQKGLIMFFEVEVENDNLVGLVRDALIGENKRVGRSRTAQYGLVSIEEFSYDECPSQQTTNNFVTVYADSRLIFLDEFGLPSFKPQAEDLGLSGTIDWNRSQIRTFQYSPWNFKRQCFDADRCGFEKGSVFFVDTTSCPESSQYVGSYRNEGFGKVIYNPAFLEATSYGEAIYKLSSEVSPQETEKQELSGTPLLDYLHTRQTREELERNVYEMVNTWVNNHRKQFASEQFASQWGKIRSIAMTHSTLSELTDNLFDGQNAYLTHGVAKEKWDERHRKADFEEFVKGLTDDNAQFAIVNLASQMAKKRKEN